MKGKFRARRRRERRKGAEKPAEVRGGGRGMEGGGGSSAVLAAGRGRGHRAGGPHVEGCGRDGAATRRRVFWEVAAKGFHHKP